MTLLKEIKKILYTGGSDNLHVKHNKAMAQIGFMDLRQEKHQDIQDFRDVFSNPKLLTNMRDAKRSLTLYCNVGKAIINKKGDLKGYRTVWFYPGRVTNILSLGNVKKKHRVTYDSTLDE